MKLAGLYTYCAKPELTLVSKSPVWHLFSNINVGSDRGIEQATPARGGTLG